MSTKPSPYYVEEQFIFALVLSFGLFNRPPRIDDTGGRTHVVLGRLLKEKGELVESLLGFTPVVDPKFGTYRCLDEALPKMHAYGLIRIGSSIDGPYLYVKLWPMNIQHYLDTWPSRVGIEPEAQAEARKKLIELCEHFRDLLTVK